MSDRKSWGCRVIRGKTDVPIEVKGGLLDIVHGALLVRLMSNYNSEIAYVFAPGEWTSARIVYEDER